MSFTHRAEVGVLGDVAGHSLVTGGGGHDQQQSVPSLLTDGAVPMDEWHEEREDEEVGGAVLSRRCSEQQLQDHGLPGHGHANLTRRTHLTALYFK